MGSMSDNRLITAGVELFPDHHRNDIDFTDSSFFKIPGRKLPSPPAVDTCQNGTVAFPEMQLVIKFGPFVTIDEAVTLWLIRKHLGAKVPVPELFGWRVHQNTVFIYMEHIPGTTLQDRWSNLNFTDKEAICSQLSQMLVHLRELHHANPFIGSVTRGPLPDRIFEDRPQAGPFDTLDDLYKWLEWLPQRFLAPAQRYTDPYLSHLPQDATIKFTHADLHPTNIIVSASESSTLNLGPPRVLALIDWGQSGWYPDYWEYYKMCYTTDYDGEWRREWIPKVIEPREEEQYLMAEYSMTIGAV